MNNQLISGSVILSPEEYAEYKTLKEEREKFIMQLPVKLEITEVRSDFTDYSCKISSRFLNIDYETISKYNYQTWFHEAKREQNKLEKQLADEKLQLIAANEKLRKYNSAVKLFGLGIFKY